MTLGEIWWVLLVVAAASYVTGNFNPAILISKLKKKDIRNEGSGNPGTMNMSRVFGVKYGVIVYLIDMLKGFAPTFIAGLIFKGKLIEGSTLPVSVLMNYVAGFCVIAGHIFPAVYSFKGGKGIASTIGVFFATEWYIALIFAVICLMFIFVTRIGSMGSFLATTPPAIFACIDIYNNYYKPAEAANGQYIPYFIVVDALIFGIVVLTWYAHRANIERLLSGDEHPTDWLGMIRDAIVKRRAKKRESALEEEAANNSESGGKSE